MKQCVQYINFDEQANIYKKSPPYPQFRFPWFYLPTVHGSLNMLNGKFQK